MGAYKYPREINWLLGRRAALPRARIRLHRLSPPVGPEGVLGDAGGNEHRRHHPGDRRRPREAPARRFAARRGDPRALLRAARAAAAAAARWSWCSSTSRSSCARASRSRTEALEGRRAGAHDDPEYPAYYKEAYAKSKGAGVRFYPDITTKDIVVATGVILVLVLLARFVGAGLEPPADPTDTTLCAASRSGTSCRSSSC